MDAMKAVDIVEGIIGSTEDEQLEAWQYLHDTGLAYQLQGWFSRSARALIEAGLIEEKSNA